MRRVLPTVGEEALDDLYLDLSFPPAPEERPHLFLDMVASVDGAASVRGRTAALGGAADRLAFRRLREWCDLILVGAGTVRVEDYGPPRPGEGGRRRRRSRGLPAAPGLAVVTRSARLDPSSRLFAAPERRPLVLCPAAAPSGRVAALEEVADVLVVGRESVDLPAALRRLRESGVSRVLCEGGPTLNGELAAADFVDEIFLTISPQLVGASPHRILHDGVEEPPRALDLLELREHAGELLLRYRVAA